MKYCSDKEINKLVSLLVKKGWLFSWGSKHGRLKHPEGRHSVTVPSTPSDYRAAKNFRRDVRYVISPRVGVKSRVRHQT